MLLDPDSGVQWPETVSVITFSNAASSRSARRAEERRRHRLGRNADDLERIRSIDETRRTVAKALRKASKRAARKFPYRWVVGTDSGMYISDPEALAIFEDALPDVIDHGVMVTTMTRRDAVGFACIAMAETGEMFAAAAAADPHDAPSHPLMTDEMAHRVRTGANSNGRAYLPWPSGDMIREKAKEAADERRKGKPHGKCLHEGCDEETTAQWLDARTGELLLEEDRSTPWATSGELVIVLDMALDDEIGATRPATPPPDFQAVACAQR